MSGKQRQLEAITSLHDLRIKNDKIKTWVGVAIEAGYSVRRTRSNHILVSHPTTGKFATLTTTHVGGRAVLDYRAQLRRIGLEVE